MKLFNKEQSSCDPNKPKHKQSKNIYSWHRVQKLEESKRNFIVLEIFHMESDPDQLCNYETDLFWCLCWTVPKLQSWSPEATGPPKHSGHCGFAVPTLLQRALHNTPSRGNREHVSRVWSVNAAVTLGIWAPASISDPRRDEPVVSFARISTSLRLRKIECCDGDPLKSLRTLMICVWTTLGFLLF